MNEQLIDDKYEQLGFYDVQTDNLTWFNKEKWAGQFFYDGQTDNLT